MLGSARVVQNRGVRRVSSYLRILAGRRYNIKGGLLERTEQRELPGNDASWYRAMIAEHAAARRDGMATEAQLRESTAAPADRDEPEDDPAAAASPHDMDPAETEVEPTTDPETEDTSATEAQPATDPETEDPAATEIEPKTDPETEDTSATEIEPTTDPETEDTSTTEIEPTTDPETEDPSATEAQPTTDPETEDTSATEAQPATDPETEDTSATEASIDSPASDVAVDEDLSGTTTATIAPVPPIEEDTPREEDSPLENTSEMVGQLWTARDSYGPLEDWQPDDIDRKVGLKRTFRWSTLIGAVAILGLIAAGLVVLPSITQSRATSYRESITAPLQTLRGELPDAQNSLAVATDPASDGAALAGLTTQLTTFAAKASDLDAATQADPPAAPPLTSSAPIDEVEPIRQQAEPLGTVAITIQRRIANLVEYRSLMGGFLVLPDLPTTATNDEQAELRVDLAAAQAESASVLADLPSDVALEGHAALAREINERFATWQVDYLEALRTGDAAAAEELIAEIENALAELDTALITPLAQIRRQSDTDLIDLAREIDAVNALAAEIG